MILRWFFSSTVRQATDLAGQVNKLLQAQRDILSPPAIEAIEQSSGELRSALRENRPKAELFERMTQLEKVANQWLKPYPNAGMRENVEVILVAVAVALAIRTFFLQPFKIPTGSMQPTLYGITHENHPNDTTFVIPTGMANFVDSWFRGISYFHVVAEADGNLEAVEAPKTVFPFVKKQRFLVGSKWHTVWFSADVDVLERAGLRMRGSGEPVPHSFRQGEDVIKLKVVTGDHLFVDRLTYNFRPPTRGEIVVFETRGIKHPNVPEDQFYIKRLVGLSGEQVRIGEDQHLVINGQRLDASTPRFENLYSFERNAPENRYFGHVGTELFSDPNRDYAVGKRGYLVMGDNTRSSLDSRYWGDVPNQNVIGKACFVYWPILSNQNGALGRFGLTSH